MVIALYQLLLWLALPFAVGYHWYRSVSRGRRAAFAERFGWLPKEAGKKLTGHPAIWLHAVSVGEVIAARPLIAGIRQRYPGHRLVLSVTTETGRTVAENSQQADLVIYFPFDIGPAVRRIISAVSPRFVIVMETELWPVFINEVSRRGIPLFLANGRISDRSFSRYRRLAWFFHPLLQKFSWLGMQTETDRERIIATGAPADRTHVLGNLKYDIPSGHVSLDQKQTLRRRYSLPDHGLVFTAASTHPGEEQQLLEVWRELAGQHPETCFVLVPRHPERATEVALMAEQYGFRCRRRTSLVSGTSQPLDSNELLLVDTVGELGTIYQLSDLVFVGGSLVPTGGHNLLEPAAAGIPSLFGPHMNNFREVATLVLHYGAGVQVADPTELLDAARDFLASPDLRQVIGGNGLKLMRNAGGASQRYLEYLERTLAS